MSLSSNLFSSTCLTGLLLLVACAPDAEGGIVGCVFPGGTDTSGPPEPVALPPRVVGVSPAAEASGLFYELDVWARFDVAPEAATLTLADADGVDVSGEMTLEESGRKIVFTPAGALRADAAYTATIAWNGGDESPASWSFTTGPYGAPVADPDGLVGKVFHLDLGSATFTEPPAVGSLLQGFLADVYLMFHVAQESDLAGGTAHIEGALGMLSGPDIVQDPCSPTLPFTFGLDGAPGTADDTAATWANPEVALSGVDLDLAIEGTVATVQDALLTMVLHPDAVDFAGGRFEGTLDTRDLTGLLGDDDDEDGICELVFKTVGVGCVECGGDSPGEFCLDVAAKDISGPALPGSIARTTCADVIARDLAGADTGAADWECKGASEDYWEVDDDGNRVGDGYPGCPEYTER